MVLKLNLTYKITSKDCDFSKTKKTNDSEEVLNEGISKTIYFYSISKQDRDSDHQTDILNNLKSWKMETKSKTNLSNVEQKELSKWRNDETIVIKPLVISKAMIMQHLLNENTYKKLDCCFDIET